MIETDMNPHEALLDSIAQYVQANGSVIAGLSAQAVVTANLIDAVLQPLTRKQSAEVPQTFRSSIEDVMASMDDVTSHTSYHNALLDHVNRFLGTLEAQAKKYSRRKKLPTPPYCRTA